MWLTLSWFLVAVASASTLHSQSSFWIRNRILADSLDAPTYNSDGEPLEGPQYRAEVYGGPAPESLEPVCEQTVWLTYRACARVAMPLETNGYFGRANPAEALVVSVPPGREAWLQVRAWDARLGDTYEAAVARGLGGYGESALFRKAGGDPGGTLPSLPQPLIGLQSFRLLPVIPEPSSWLLLAVGGVLMRWVVRNRCLG